MENEKKILEQILENTQEVKRVIVKKPKEQKELTAQQKAQAKFKKVGCQLNQAEQERFKAILKAKDTTANAYIKKLIFSGNESVLEEALTQQVEALKIGWKECETENKKNLEIIENQKKKIAELEADIASIENYGFWQLVKLRFFGE